MIFLGCLAALPAVVVGITRYYNDHYGRVRLTTKQQVRFTVASFACFGIPLIAGPMLDFRLDLPVSAFAVLFGLGMLVWFAVCVGLRWDHVAVWGTLVAVTPYRVWGGFADRASVRWLPIDAATIVAGILETIARSRAASARRRICMSV